ncbi:hypothetical protein 2 [Changjiang picorna-like virus 7]|uniref:hypothetical protein 2 n=1 Tax=Changjiang picorna-like virus 7 TaxID=1922796 RepID=UPI00090C824E|nr:hypothetical protein 2 [Changjiang picorna-like virus 7]APG79024.1 hypothetical protein 2 [Changjiang picorna-like virus 7]
MLFNNTNPTTPEVAQVEKCDEIEGITVQGRTEDYDVASFNNEAAVCAEAPGTTSYTNLKQDIDDNSIRRLLSRPVLITAGNLAAAPGRPAAASFQSADFRNAFGTLTWDRMNGYLGVRFTLKITCIISKTAFHQGVLSLVWQYGCNTDNKFRGNHFPLSVHLPNVRMNLAEETMMVLSVPFVFSEEYLKISTVGTDLQRYGSYALVNLTGCPVVAGQSVPRYSIYFSMEDVELIGHVPFNTTTVVTQSGVPKHSEAHMKAGGASRSRVTDEGHAKGVLSGAVSAMSGVANAVSLVPGLSSVGGAADWFLRSTSGALEAFGFSKPLDEKLTTRVARNIYTGEGQTDLPNVGFSLAPFQSNKLAVDASVGCTEEDHMALDYILTKYSYIYRGEYSTTQSTGDTIYTAPITPSAFWYRDRALSVVGATGNLPLKAANTATENAFYPSTLCYLSDNFRYWRGNLKFRFTFACTKLHGGRVVATFIPVRSTGINAGTPITTTRVIPTTGGTGPNLTGESMVFDLQDGTTFEYVVPFVYPNAYCGVLSEYIGDLSLMVVSPLTANSVVPSIVNFMVEVCAEPGFELAVNTASLMSAVPGAGTLAVSFQSGLSDLTVSNKASEQCIGEVFKSVKSLMQIPDYYVADIAGNTIGSSTLDPWFKPNCPAVTTPMSTTTQALYFAARSSRVAEMYAYVRGSTGYVLLKDRTGSLTHSFKFATEDGNVSSATLGSFYDKGLAPNGCSVVPEALESSRVVIPTYAKIPRIPLDIRDFGFGGARSFPTNDVWLTSATNAVPTLWIRNNTAAGARYMLGRFAADDAICSQFIGPPPVIILNVLATTNPIFGSGIGTEW